MTREEAYLKALELYQKTYPSPTNKGTVLFGSSTYAQILEIANWLLGNEEEDGE